MNNEYLFLASEVAQIKELLKGLPERNLLERMSLEARLNKVKKELKNLPKQTIEKVQLTFRGKPVRGSYGIAADFATKAAGAFSSSFTSILAALNENLSNAGPFPKQDQNQLFITGTAIGSFGFEFELPQPEPTLLPDAATPKQAVEKLELLMRLSAEGSDDDVAEAIEEIHPRAVGKLYEFMDYLAQQQAWCTLKTKERTFAFTNARQLKISSERLKSENIKESKQTFEGIFKGALPDGRQFEFELSNGKGSFRGKIDKQITKPEELAKQWLFKPVKVEFSVIQVGQAKPRYILSSLESLKENKDKL